jgi:hypothetical protein
MVKREIVRERFRRGDGEVARLIQDALDQIRWISFVACYSFSCSHPSKVRSFVVRSQPCLTYTICSEVLAVGVILESTITTQQTRTVRYAQDDDGWRSILVVYV